MQIKNLVFASGALGGIAYIGALQALHEQGLSITNIHGLSGCSIGAVMSLLFTLGYTPIEMRKIALGFKQKKYSDIQVLGFLEHCGLDTGRKLVMFLSEIIHYKTGLDDLTFEQHWNITGRDLWINCSCIKTNKAQYYSVKTTPKLSILRAIRRSISIPFLFTTERNESSIYIDGAYHDPIPCFMFNPKTTLCLKVVNHNISNQVDPSLGYFVDFCLKLVTGMHRSLSNYRINLAKINYNVIEIVTGVSPLDLNLKTKVKKALIDLGYKVIISSNFKL